MPSEKESCGREGVPWAQAGEALAITETCEDAGSASFKGGFWGSLEEFP